MKESQTQKLDLFVSNSQDVKKEFAWQGTLLSRLAALLYAAENKVVDCVAIRDSYELIKEQTGLFSAFRGNSRLCVATLLSLCPDKVERLSGTLTVYNRMKEAGFHSSDYLVVAAYQIAANAIPAKWDQAIERSKAFYDGMKEKHRFLTGQDDYIFSALLGISDVEISTGLAQLEETYVALKPEFSSKSGLQALTQVLVLGGKSSDLAGRVTALSDAFQRNNIRLDKEYTTSSLGILALLPADVSALATNVEEVYNFLRAQKGFGAWSITKQELLLFSAALVAYEYADAIHSGLLTTTLSTSITNIIIAQQIAAIAAATAAASASTT